jgi:Domain of unknown function (DUF4249)
MKQLLFSAAIALTLFSCRKVINVDLNNADPRLVIEGVVDNMNPAFVEISKSVIFSNNNIFPTVSGALVKVTDNLGGSFNFTETTPGKYVNGSLIGVPGRTYTLSVVAEGKTYTAVSIMPTPVNLDTLLFEKLIFGSTPTWAVKPQYTDPAGFGNYYKFYETINNRRFPDYWVWDDKFTNNGVSTRPLIQTDTTIRLNDTVEVEMQCIDKNVYRYFLALLDVKQNNTVPANPESNITGGCLGYFSAHTTQKKKARVKE